MGHWWTCLLTLGSKRELQKVNFLCMVATTTSPTAPLRSGHLITRELEARMLMTIVALLKIENIGNRLWFASYLAARESFVHYCFQHFLFLWGLILMLWKSENEAFSLSPVEKKRRKALLECCKLLWRESLLVKRILYASRLILYRFFTPPIPSLCPSAGACDSTFFGGGGNDFLSTVTFLPTLWIFSRLVVMDCSLLKDLRFERSF